MTLTQFYIHLAACRRVKTRQDGRMPTLNGQCRSQKAGRGLSKISAGQEVRRRRGGTETLERREALAQSEAVGSS